MHTQPLRSEYMPNSCLYLCTKTIEPKGRRSAELCKVDFAQSAPHHADQLQLTV